VLDARCPALAGPTLALSMFRATKSPGTSGGTGAWNYWVVMRFKHSGHNGFAGDCVIPWW